MIPGFSKSVSYTHLDVYKRQTKGDVAKAVENGAGSFKEVKAATKAGKACGKCKKKVKKLTKKLLEKKE